MRFGYPPLNADGYEDKEGRRVGFGLPETVVSLGKS